MGKDCLFCKIIKREIPSKIEFENDNIIAFWDVKPIAPVHILIVPKKHIVNLATVSNLDKELLGEMSIAAGNLAKKLGISKAFRTATANGEDAGQSVYHMHLHLTGGWKEKYERQTDKA